MAGASPAGGRIAWGLTDLERPADPGALVLVGLEAARLHQGIGVLVPAAVREIVAEHGGGGLRLVDDAERHVGLGQAHQRLLDVPRRLIARHHDLEAVDGGRVVLALHIPAPDVHLLAGELVARHLDLALGGDRVLRIGILAHHLFERLHRLVGALLVTRDLRDLVVVGRADEELRIGHVGTARMQSHVAPRGIDAIVVHAGFVIGESGHDQRFARPFRIGMLAVDFLELLGGVLGALLLVQKEETLVVELVGRLIGDDRVLLERAEACLLYTSRCV